MRGGGEGGGNLSSEVLLFFPNLCIQVLRLFTYLLSYFTYLRLLFTYLLGSSAILFIATIQNFLPAIVRMSKRSAEGDTLDDLNHDINSVLASHLYQFAGAVCAKFVPQPTVSGIVSQHGVSKYSKASQIMDAVRSLFKPAKI